MTLLEVPTGSKNAPNRFPVEFYPKRYVRLPFSQKIFSENRKKRKNLPGRLRNPSRKKNRDLNRISLTLSNRDSLVSAYSRPTLTNRFRLRYIYELWSFQLKGTAPPTHSAQSIPAARLAERGHSVQNFQLKRIAP